MTPTAQPQLMEKKSPLASFESLDWATLASPKSCFEKKIKTKTKSQMKRFRFSQVEILAGEV
jgi:hypothetical protein